jgi:hypothetical protein
MMDNLLAVSKKTADNYPQASLVRKASSPQRRREHRETAEKRDEEGNEKREDQKRRREHSLLLLSAFSLCSLRLCGERAFHKLLIIIVR